MSDPAGRSPESVERLPESAEPLPEAAEERPDRPAAPGGDEDAAFAPGYGISSGTAAAVARGVMPPDDPTGAGAVPDTSEPESGAGGTAPEGD